VIGGYRDET